MRLAIPSLILCCYVIASLIAFLPCRPAVKVVTAIALLAVSQKYLFFELIGGSFLAPNLPRPLLLAMEVMYAALLILAFLLVIKDGLVVLLWLSRFLGTQWSLPFSPGARAMGLVLAALFLAGWGTWQSLRVPEVRTVEIRLARLPKALDGFNLVQLSDIHIGLLLGKEWLRGVVEKTNALAPDLVVLTGDMIDGSPEELGHEVAPLSELRAQHGIFGVTGNHEYYFQAERWLPVFQKMGIAMLNNEHMIVSVDDADLVIAGLPDPAGRWHGGPKPDLQQALAGAPDAVRILLAHQPHSATGNTGVDLQLSGHTHGGHLFFLQWLIATFNGGLVKGLYAVGGMQLYVSPGTGIWEGFSCRLGVPSEITRIVLRAQNQEDITRFSSKIDKEYITNMMAAQLKTLIDRTCSRYREISNKEFYFMMTAAVTDKELLQRTLEAFRGFTACLSAPIEKGVINGTGAWNIG